MSISIQLTRHGWLTRTMGDATAHIRGQAHIGDEYLNTSALADRFLAQTTVDDLDRLVSTLNGTWAAVVEKGDAVYLAVDHIRSIQLLHHVESGLVEVFDDLVDYRKSHTLVPDERGVHEYLSSGYVYSYRTLFRDIFSLQAAERVVISAVQGEAVPTVERKRYWHYIPMADRAIVAGDELVQRIDACFIASIKRLQESVGDRRIVVPLSGGYDSRLIVNYLYKTGFRKVLCYTYGDKGNAESRCSQMVANNLGYEWHFVEVTAQDRETLASAPSQTAGYLYQTNGVNRYCLQESIALCELKSQGILDTERDVIVPGYYFDILAGSEVKPWVMNSTAASEMCEWENNFFSHRHFLASIKAVRRVFDENADVPAKHFHEGWAWQERLTKFIVNNVRSFEFLGFDWRLPLCDRELFDLWLSIPCSMRYGRNYFFSIFNQLAVPEIRNCPTVHDHGKLSVMRQIRHAIGTRTPYVIKYPLMRWINAKHCKVEFDELVTKVPSLKPRLIVAKNVTSNAKASLRGLKYELMKVS